MNSIIQLLTGRLTGKLTFENKHCDTLTEPGPVSAFSTLRLALRAALHRSHLLHCPLRRALLGRGGPPPGKVADMLRYTQLSEDLMCRPLAQVREKGAEVERVVRCPRLPRRPPLASASLSASACPP